MPKSLKASSQEKRSKVFILGTIITWEDEFLRMMPGCWDGELDTWAKHKCDNSSPNYHSTVISSPQTPRPTEPLDSIIQGWGVVKGGSSGATAHCLLHVSMLLAQDYLGDLHSRFPSVLRCLVWPLSPCFGNSQSFVAGTCPGPLPAQRGWDKNEAARKLKYLLSGMWG